MLAALLRLRRNGRSCHRRCWRPAVTLAVEHEKPQFVRAALNVQRMAFSSMIGALCCRRFGILAGTLMSIVAADLHGQAAQFRYDATRDSLTLRNAASSYQYHLGEEIRAHASQEARSYRRLGAAVGGVVGVVSTYLALNAGGSTSLCDQSANQDATSSGLCFGLYALGGLVGAGVGSFIGGAISVERRSDFAAESLRVGLRIQLIH